MIKKKAVVSAVALAALLSSAAIPSAQAITVDTTPPNLVSFELSPLVVDARQGGSVTARMHITDQTCLDGSPTLLMKNALDNSYSGLRSAKRVSGDCKDGLYEVSIPVSAGDLGRQPFGSWSVTIYPLSDVLRNSAGLYHPSFFGDRTFTYAASPDAVQNLAVTSVTSSSLSASWTAPDTNGSPITKYVAVLKNAAGATMATKTVTGASFTDLSVALVGGQPYSLEVTAYNKVGGTETARTTFTSPITVYPQHVVFTDKDGTANDTYTVPAKTGVQYYVNGVAKAAGTYKGAGTITVTAKAKSGYALSGTSSWQKTFSKNVVVTATAATFADKSGTTYDRYTIPAKTGVQYYVNGVAKAAGTYKGTGTITVTAKAKTGYTLTGTTSWKRTFSKNVVVTATAATFSDKSGTTYDRYTIPAKTGVQYYVNGVAKAAGTYKASGTITVTAKAKTGYTLTGTSTWKRTFGR
ncbi:fibronectin type III domain-containing protein [Kocuria arenosa]|uniref:fibronectin type III domain-containing protein n=1 Tax=Kocuria arenosa TaxID=3071446 RepID=UPI0034D52176